MKTPQSGFTLIEIAIVLVIVGLLLGGLLMPLSTQIDLERRKQTEKTLEEIKEALIGYAVTKQHLPCPDITGDGVADPATVTINCTGGQEGLLPWVTLGVAQADAWGNRFRYRVSPKFTNTPNPAGTCDASLNFIGLCIDGNITINTRNPATKAVESLAGLAAALILSHGKNGLGATISTGGSAPSPPANTDELRNTDNDATFYSRTLTNGDTVCSDTAAGQPYCEFDDAVAWLPPNILFNRMVAAGVLP